MPLAVLELNDQSLLMQAEGGLLHAEPGFAHLTAAGITTGEDARAAAWREPQFSYNQYWCHLNETPLPARQKWARHHADIAFAQLGHLWHSAGSPDELIILAPGSFTDAQLSLVLGMVNALPSRAAAVLDSAVANCLAISQETLFIDLQLHQTVLTRVRPSGDSIDIADQDVYPDLGMMQIQNSAARHISDLLISHYRHDPRHASDSEQAIYDQLPALLARLRWEVEVADQLVAGQRELPFILRRQEVAAKVEDRLAGLWSIFERHRDCQWLMSKASELLAGLSAELENVEIQPQAAGAEQVLEHHQHILGQIEGLYRVRSLRRAAAAPDEAPAGAALATHVLHGDRALPLRKPVSIRLGEDGVQLASRLDTAAALTVVLRNGSLEALHSAGGVTASLPARCRPGDAIVVEGHALQLIEVRDG